MISDSLTGSKTKTVIYCLFLSVIASIVWTEALLYSQNNLHFNETWTSYRIKTFGGQAGGVDNQLSRSHLAGNRLRTDNYVINNRVYSRKSYKPTVYEIEARMAPFSYLEILFNVENDSYELVRFSRYRMHSSGYYKVNPKHQYTHKEPFKVLIKKGEKFKVRLKERGNQIDVYLRDELISTINSTFKSAPVGIEVTLNAEVLNARVRENKTWVDLPFDNTEERLSFIFKNFGLIILFILLSGLFSKPYYVGLLRSSAIMAGVGIIWYSYDYYYHSRLHYRWDMRSMNSTFQGEEKIIDLEAIRYNFFKKWYVMLGGEELKRIDYPHVRGFPELRICEDVKCQDYALRSDYQNTTPFKKSADTVRLMYIGGSTSAGAGLMDLNESYFNIVHNELKKRLPSKKIESINVSEGVLVLKERLQDKMNDINFFKPDYVLIDYLMLEPSRFKQLMEAIPKLTALPTKIIITRNTMHYILYSSRPLDEILNDFEKGLNTEPKHRIEAFKYDRELSELHKKYPFAWFDPNIPLLKDRFQSGTIFMDHAHYTAIGHEIIGKYLAGEIFKLIGEADKTSP